MNENRQARPCIGRGLPIFIVFLFTIIPLFFQFVELHPVNFHFNGQLLVVGFANP